MGEIGLYLHIPFCVRKCAYCDFLSFPAGEEMKKIYASALIREIRGYRNAAEDSKVTSIFLGGGTPSLMPVRQLRAVFQAIYDTFPVDKDAEITMEMNPGTVNEALMSFVFDSVNRVSLGMQSAVDEELVTLGRIHTFEDVRKSVELLRESGVKNLNLDLMSGIPGQTEASWARTLSAAVSLGPEHISAYSLIVEEGTPFFRMKEEGSLVLPDEETERRMYTMTRDVLARSGYAQYEFSNYAREGFRCRHNIRYWKRGDYLGFGVGAASLFRGSRWSNTRDVDEYIRLSPDPGALVRGMERLNKRAEIEEYMFLGLRMTEGVSSAAFREAFGVEIRDLYGDVIDRQIRSGLMDEPKEGTFRLTDRGIDISNVVLAEYLLD